MDDPQVISMADAATQPSASEDVVQETPTQEAPHQTAAEAKPEAPPSEAVQKLTEQLTQLSVEAERVTLALQFMKEALANQPRPRFKDFWDARRALMILIKPEGQELAAEVTEQLQAISQEARKLKAALDEKATAAMAQMEAAVQAIEVDVHHLAEAIRAVPEITQWPSALAARQAEYTTAQREAAVLSQLAHRMTLLRKEVLSADMRIRHKNQLLARLSTAGDKVYPRRKELITRLSQWFEADVQAFMEAFFKGDQVQGMLNAHREEIKALQQIAKQLSLNATAFNRTRLQLGEAWERVKSADLERKRARQEKMAVHAQANQEVLDKVVALEAKAKEQMEGQAGAEAEVEKLKVGALAALRQADLPREQIKSFKDRIFAAVKPLEQKEQDVRDEKKRVVRAQEDAYRQRVRAIEAQLDALEPTAAKLGLEELQSQIGAIQQAMEQQALLMVDQEGLRRRMMALGDIALLARAGEARDAEALNLLIQEVKKRRQTLRQSVDELRKSRGGSALDVTRGLQAEAELAAEKGRLDQINHLLYELESKVYAMQQG
ncbi:MAG: hypothetical protein ACOYKZ_00700 [Chlamydiia bacterium]